jgi:outer membrane protein
MNMNAKSAAIIMAVSIGVFIISSTVSFGADVAKIGVVDLQRILIASDPGKAAQADLKKVGTKLEENFKAKEAEIIKLKEALEREALVMSRETREEKEREYRIKVNDFKTLQKKSMQELKDQEARLVSKIREELKGVIEEVGKKEGYLLIIDKAVLHYYPNSIDATDMVIQKYNEASAAPASTN